MTRKRRQFDASFKLEVVRMVRDQGLSVGEVCRSMELGESAIRRWKTPAEALDEYLKSVQQFSVATTG